MDEPRTSEGLIRTFVAVDVPEAAKLALAEAVEPARRQFRLKWTSPKAWHLTLKFLGEIPQNDVEKAIQATQMVAGHVKVFDAELGGWGAFPNPKRPRVLWVGMTVGAEKLREAANSLERSFAEIGFPPEKRDFHPHLTLARGDDPVAGSRAFELLSAQRLVPELFPVDRIVVYRSILDRRGAEYHPLAVGKLGS